MHFYNIINELSKNQKISLYVDMDGVIASYDAGKKLDFKNKRPLTENINKLEKIAQLSNVDLYILSICKKNSQIIDKNNWLDKNASFFIPSNRIIISKEQFPNTDYSTLKVNYLKNLITDTQIVLIDDDNAIIKAVLSSINNIIVFQDSELIDWYFTIDILIYLY